MERKYALILGAIVFGVLIAFSGCIDDTESEEPEGEITGPTGELILEITDAPTDLNITKAEVNISKVKVHLSEDGNTTGNNTNTSNTTSGWFTVVEGVQTFDLIALVNVTDVLGSAQLQSGHYTQIRLDVDAATATIGGVDYELTIPSKTIKLTKGFDIETNKTTTLTLDFDAQKSIHKTGSGKYMMRPTIKIIQE